MINTEVRQSTHENRETAESMMRQRNRTKGVKVDMTVLVEGPGDGQVTLMGLREAVESCFSYSWS